MGVLEAQKICSRAAELIWQFAKIVEKGHTFLAMNLTLPIGLGRWTRLAGLFFLVTNVLPLLSAGQLSREQLRANAQSKVKALSLRGAEILAPTQREEQLRADCSVNCSAVVDTVGGKTVSDELDAIATSKADAIDRIIAEMQIILDDYIVRAIPTIGPDLDSASVAYDLGLILEGVTAQPPQAFLVRSPKGNSIVVFYGLKKSMMSTSSVLRAYVASAKGLKFSDSTGSDMDDYFILDTKELHSPRIGEICLLVSGQMNGANGPNIRMRVFAYDGAKFRTVWMPANEWGTFAATVTPDGFSIDGQLYRSDQQSHNAYVLATDGIYLKTPE